MPELLPILHIMPAEPFGGLQALVIELARVQRDVGKRVEIVLLDPSARVEARCRAAGLTPLVLDGPKALRAAKLAQLLLRTGPAIVHSHCEAPWASAVLAAFGKNWVIHLHVYASQETLRDRFGGLLRKRFAHRFIAISHSVEASFVELGLASPRRSSVVYNGLDFAPSPAPSQAEPVRTSLTVGFVGRAVREKGLFDFIEVADRLRDTIGLRFIIAGEGADLDAARAEIAARSLEDRVQVLGFVENIDALWPSLDMFLMLSTREPFGLVILEAIARGVAVLGYDIPSGGSEIMAMIPGCHMVEAFSIEALAEAISATLADRATLEADLVEGRATVLREFSLSRMEADVAREYEILCERR